MNNELITECTAIDLPIGDRTRKYIGINYLRGLGQLQAGDLVIVHPIVGISQSQEPYQAVIELNKIKWWHEKEVYEVCTRVADGHSAVINDYLFSRLERIG